MNGIQTKTMFNEVVKMAAENKRQVSLQLSEVEGKVAEKIAQTPSLNRAQFEQGINAIKEKGGDLATPSAETLRAYAGIDQPITVYSHNFPKKK